MQVNRVNASPSFGATIKETKALKQFINSLYDGAGRDVKLGGMPRTAIIENFNKIHSIFPQETDVICFTKHADLCYGPSCEGQTKKLVEGYVNSNGKKANFAFTYRWLDACYYSNYQLTQMHYALREALRSIKTNTTDVATSIVKEITQAK